MLDEEMLRAFLRGRERYFHSSIPIDAGLTFEKPTTKIKEDTMDENIDKEEEEGLDIVAKVEITQKGSNIYLNILEQYRFNFLHDIKMSNGKNIYLSSSAFAQYIRGSDGYELYLRGNEDKGDYEVILEIPKRSFDCFWSYIEKYFILNNEEKKPDEREEVLIDFSFDKEPTDEEIDEMISKVDLDTFTAIIRNRVYEESREGREHLGFLNREWAKEILREWAKAKYRLYKIFGDKLIVDKEVEVKSDATEILKDYRALKDEFPLYCPILENTYNQWVVENKLSGIEDWRISRDPRVCEGMKFTKFISLYGNEELNTALSKIYQNINKCKISLSINPIDFLTVSVNNSGWHSCHNFFDGAYKNGGASYMFDFSSFVAYSSTKEVTYDRKIPFKWNSKNWRQMVYSSANSSTTVFSRQYPNQSDEKSKIVRKMFRDLYCAYYKCPNKWKVFDGVNNVNVNNKWYTLYNDTKHSHPMKTLRNKADVRFNEADIIEISSRLTAINKDTEIGSGDKLWQS